LNPEPPTFRATGDRAATEGYVPGVSDGGHNDFPTQENFAFSCGSQRDVIITWAIENTTSRLAALHQKL